MPTIEANGQTLYYEVHGEGEPLLCVMGLAADVLAWTLQVPAFSAGHRTVIFDNRDVGRSSMAGEDYEIADMARDALALADALELESFDLLGVSMGGAIAQEMACQAPERIRTLTLAVTFAAGGPWAHKLSRGLGLARAQGHARGAHGRAHAAQPVRGVLREPADGGVRPRHDAQQPPPAAAGRLRAPAGRVEPPRHAATGWARCRFPCT